MIKQRVNSNSSLRITAQFDTASESAIVGLLAGEVEVYKEVAKGGTPLPSVPAELNRKDLVVGAKGPAGTRYSWYLSVPHVKQASTYPKIASTVIGSFDCAFDRTEKAEYAKMRFDSNKKGA